MVSYLVNTIDRFDLTPRVTVKNISTAGMHIRQRIITDNGSSDQRIKRWGGMFAHKHINNETNIGNPQAINNALSIATGDIIVIAGNDILLGANWLSEAIKVLNADPKVALVGFGNSEGPDSEIGGVKVSRHPIGTTGTWVIRKTNFNQLGYFATFSKYGFWDGDYCNRLRASGLKDVYIPHITSEHVGADYGEDTEYRKMKDKEAKKAWPHIKELAGRYSKKAHYLNRDNKLVNTNGKVTRKRKRK